MKSFFVSSTFRDMNQERDAIRNHVMPELNEIAGKYGESIAFCDLRWGVNTTDLESDEAFLKVIDVCLDEIDRCNPYMVVLLGDRYGWCPAETLVEMVTSQRQGIKLPSKQASITALEIAYGALGSHRQKDKTLFYFREIEGNPPAFYRSESAEDAQRVAALKRTIVKHAPDRVRTYRVRWDESRNCFVSLTHFCDMLVSDIRRMMEQQWRSSTALTPYQRDQVEQWGLIRQKETGFAARQPLVDEIIRRAHARDGVLALQGPSGCGKSTLMSRTAMELQRKNADVLPIFCGSTNLCCHAIDIVKYIVHHLENRLNLAHFTDSRNGVMADDKQWCSRLQELYGIYDQRNGKPLTILIDAVDQLAPDGLRDKLQFLPQNRLRRIGVVISILDSFLVKKRLPILPVPPVEPADRQQIIRAQLNTLRTADSVAQPVVDAIMSKPGSTSPLYLSLLLQRLDMLDRYDYAVIQSAGDEMSRQNVKNAQMQAITDYQLKLIRECPDNVDQMCAHILQQTAAQLGGNMTMICAELIAVSRYGLRESDLAAVFHQIRYPWNSLDFSRFRKYLRRFFIYRKDGRIDFAHRIFREGIMRRCTDQRRVHALLLQHFSGLAPTDEVRVQEITHHMICADDRRAFAAHITANLHSPYVLSHAAQSILANALADRGQWLLSLIRDDPGLLRPALLEWLGDSMWKFLAPTQERLEIECIVLEGIRDHWRRQVNSDCSAASETKLAYCCHRLGQVRCALGAKEDLKAAMSAFDECKQLRVKLAQSDTPHALEDLAEVYDSIAGATLQQKDSIGLLLGDLDTSEADAAQLYGESLKLRQKIAVKQSDRASLEKLAGSYETYSSTLHHVVKGNKDAKKSSLDAAQEALRLRTNLNDTYRDTDTLSRLAAAYENLGQIQQFYGMTQEAAQSYGGSLQIRTWLAQQLGDENARRGLSGVYKKIGILCDYASFRDLNALILLIGRLDSREAHKDQAYALDMHRQSLRLDEALARELNTVDALDQYQQSLFNIITNFRSNPVEKINCAKIRHQIRKELFIRTGNTKFQNIFLRNYYEIKRVFLLARDKFGNVVWLVPIACVIVFILIMTLAGAAEKLLISLLDNLFPN